MKNLFRSLAMLFALAAGGQAEAGIPVIDVANLGQQIQQVVSWGQQYSQMAQQYQQLVQQYQQAVQTYTSLNGVRGMAGLSNNPSLRTYLPPDWQQTMQLMEQPGPYGGLSGSIAAIRDAARVVDLGSTSMPSTSLLGQQYLSSQNQAAINRGVGEAGYRAASDRIGAIQVLLEKVNNAPDAKDIADLQARISAEQAMVQNENVKLAALSQLQMAQRDLQAQRAREISIRAGNRPMPAGW